MGSIARPKIQSIAVVGGGPSGIATAKYLLAEKIFSEIDIFEQSGTVEGAWKHISVESEDRPTIPQTIPHRHLPIPKDLDPDDGGPHFVTPMYDRLETNIPHQLMGFADKPFPDGSALYPPREVVSEYLEEYAQDIRPLISFHTQVQDVHFIGDQTQDKWEVKIRDLLTGQVSSKVYDAVVICSGHYDLTYIPDVPGITKWNEAYPNTISHSKLYRTPESYRNKKTVVVGNSASGSDIANQIADAPCKHPLIVSQRSLSWMSGSNSESQQSRLKTLPQIVEFLDPAKHTRAVRFADGVIESDIDKILYCTGYLYYFSFLSSFLEDILRDGSRVHGLYKYIFFMQHPTLAFIGLPIRMLPFPLAEAQAAVLAKVWNEQLGLPSMDEMKKWEQDVATEYGEDRKFMVLEGRDFKYHNDLYDWAASVGFAVGRSPKRWSDADFWLRRLFPKIKKAYTDKGDARGKVKTPEDLDFSYPGQDAVGH